MRAVQYAEFGGPEVLQVVDVPDPHAGLSEVRIVVRAVGVNKKRIDRQAADILGRRTAPELEGSATGPAPYADLPGA